MGWSGGKGRLGGGGGGASLKTFPGLILCPRHLQLVLTGSEGAEGGDGLLALRHVVSMGPCPWEMPLIRTPNLRCAEASPEGQPRGSSPGAGTSSVPGDGTWHGPSSPAGLTVLGEGRGSDPFSGAAGRGMKRQTAPGDMGARGGPCPHPSSGASWELPQPVSSHHSFNPGASRSIPRDQGRKIPRGAVPRVSGCSREGVSRLPEPGEPVGCCSPARTPPAARQPVRRAGTRWGWQHAAGLLRPAPGEEGREEGRGPAAGRALPGERRGLSAAEA